MGGKSHLATLASNLLGLANVQAEVSNWWGFLKRTLMDNADQPPTSTRAAKYMKARRDARGEMRQYFSLHDIMRGEAARQSPRHEAPDVVK